MSNLLNSLVRFSLHPTGEIQDYMTGEAHKPDVTTIDDGTVKWDTAKLSEALRLQKHVETAIVGMSDKPAEQPKKGKGGWNKRWRQQQQEQSNVKTDDGSAGGATE